jgi:hypothetical protein
LDTLLEKYLCLLDRQQKLQSSLAEQLSSVCLFFKTILIVRRIYWQLLGILCSRPSQFLLPSWAPLWPRLLWRAHESNEEYVSPPLPLTIGSCWPIEIDRSIKSERHTEQSTKELQGNAGTTEPLDAHSTFSVELIPSPVPEEDPIGNVEAQVSSPVEGTQPESPQESPDSSQPNITLVEKPRATRKKFGSADPIHWYGILVPQSLRKAQASFTAAIDHEVPDLASTTDEMRALEQQITNLRDQLKSESSHDTS